MKHLPLRACGYVIGILAVLAGLYLGAYFVLLERLDMGELVATRGTPEYREMPAAHYYCGEWGYNFFRPAHCVDRILRPAVWANEYELDSHGRGIRRIR
jgi:hypothetical protein